MYEDRTTAGRALVDRLAERSLRPDVVFALPTAGRPVARPIADQFDATLGVMAAAPIRSRDDPSLPVGAVTDTGHAWVDDRLVEAFGVDDDRLDAETQRAFREARTERDGVESTPTPAGTVALVADGLVNGMAMKACASALGRVDGCDVVSAAPVGLPETVAELHALADDVVVAQRTRRENLLEPMYAASDAE
ncbi:Predicted phosphoribosyltransferase [Haloplanus vescus]|uniref:Predicted phosphoribosyltransferase n=1 Tax=Haloplanus vescus TaxID=555874 RepID=A0A1H3VN35_9EURY|nr:phosphoribosyltransferase family protein [Haloplanus vescus]SDZ76180.1 Predicted phosphoribosyltransferase [Haloplanus vescus]